MLGASKLGYEQTGKDFRIVLPDKLPGNYAYVIRLTGYAR
jgi:hypothetical protein